MTTDTSPAAVAASAPTDAWSEGLAALRRFVAREGSALVPATHREGSHRLGRWVTHQRSARRAGGLSAERIAALDAVGMDWDPLGGALAEGLRLLAGYVAQVGNARVPATWHEGGYSLGEWVTSQRKHYKHGHLPADRVTALDALGMVWDVHEVDFQRNLDALRAYVARVGHARVPGAHVEGDLHLGQWIWNRRREHRNGTLSADRTAALDALGMVLVIGKGQRSDLDRG